jgi:nitrogen-specific signal transduction histidine kinase
MKKPRTRHTSPSPLSPRQTESMAALAEGMADDFNNILTTVMGACSLIDRDDSANGELLHCVALIRSSAEHAADLSDRLMLASTAGQASPGSAGHQRVVAAATTSVRDKKGSDDIVSSVNLPGGTSS